MSQLCRKLAILVSVLLAPLAAAAQSSGGRQLVVAIVAVSNFDDPQFQSPLLQQAIHKAADDLEQFFRDKFPMAKILVRKEHDETKVEALRGFFRDELFEAAKGNVTLLFIISHGRSLAYDNPLLGHDLKIISSDTPPDKLQAKSLSLGTDVIGQLQNLKEGSLVFAFVDACYSGAAAGLALDVDTALKTALGVKMMLMTSALSDQEMIQATFTQSLLEWWTDSAASGCTVPEASRDKIRDKIEKQLAARVPPITLGTNEGYPEVVIHFPGLFCIESFGTMNSIATIFNSTGDSYIASFTDSKGNTHNEALSSHQVSPVMLARDRYSLSYYRNNSQVGISKTLDMSSAPFFWDLIGVPDKAELGLGLERASNLVASAGFAKEASDLRERAYASYLLAGDLTNTQRLAAVINKTAGIDASWIFAKNLAFKPFAHISSTLSAKNVDHLSAAREFQTVGDLKTSAILLSNLAENSGTPAMYNVPQQALGQEAYFAYAGAGDYKSARELRKRLKLSIDTCKDCMKLESSALKGDAQAMASFSDLSVTRLMNEAIKLDVGPPPPSPPAPDWQKHLDWAIANQTGADQVDCPEQYAKTHAECLAGGGRACLMKKAIEAAAKDACSDALQLSLVTQCHNSKAQSDLQMAGAIQVCSFLKTK